MQANQASLGSAVEFETTEAEFPRLRRSPPAVAVADIAISVHEDIAAVETDWRAFERTADATAFQTFAWLSAWLRTVGLRRSVRPAIVTGRGRDGELLFLIPLAVEPGAARKLCWLGSDLGDYNAPLLAPEFAQRLGPAGFAPIWREIVERLQSHPELRYDFIHFEKMPAQVGAQENPFLQLGGFANPSGAYLAQLSGNWDDFYNAKRSSATRRRDRTKRKRLAEIGEVRLVNTTDPADIARSLDLLMAQKSQAFARMGVADIFARPGWREFYRDVAADPANAAFVHVSRLEVAGVPAAINLGLTFGGCYYHVLASYDGASEAAKFGPGAAHLHDLMRHAIERGCRTFDFTIGDEPYKRDWADTELTLYDHVAVATWRGALPALPLAGMRAVKRFVKRTPLLWSATTRIRELSAALRSQRES